METVSFGEKILSKENMGYLLFCTSSDVAKKPKMHHLRLSVKRIFPFILSFDCSGCAWYQLINFPGLSLNVNMTLLSLGGYPSALQSSTLSSFYSPSSEPVASRVSVQLTIGWGPWPPTPGADHWWPRADHTPLSDTHHHQPGGDLS